MKIEENLLKYINYKHLIETITKFIRNSLSLIYSGKDIASQSIYSSDSKNKKFNTASNNKPYKLKKLNYKFKNLLTFLSNLDI